MTTEQAMPVCFALAYLVALVFAIDAQRDTTKVRGPARVRLNDELGLWPKRG